MSYHAKVFTVMIASPGDVESERAIVRAVLYEWNAIHSESRGIVLLPVGRESHSTPEMGAPAQDLINKHVLDKCDLLAGVFWTRIGTKTKEHASGSVEEIERHIAAGKPTMLYFSNQPAHLDTVDQQQYDELKKFKSSCRERGLLEGYDSHSEFKDKFFRQLQIKVNEHELFKEDADFQDDKYKTVEVAESYEINLSRKAKIILKEATDGNGTVMYLRVMRGPVVQVNKKNLIEGTDKRNAAAWEAAMDELIAGDLIKDRGHKGEVFEVTHAGYQLADGIVL